VNLYDRIQERVLRMVETRLEAYRVSHLTTAPDFAKFMYEKGPGWDTFLKASGSGLKAEFEAQFWRKALCELLSVMGESQVELESRIQDLESKLHYKK